MILTSYDFDSNAYREKHFNTYSGSISVYNERIELIRENNFEKGRLRETKVWDEDGFLKIVIHFPPSPEPEPDPGGGNVDWCAVYPPLCDYSGGDGGGGFDPTTVMMDPGDGGGGGGGGGGYDPFAGKELAPDNYFSDRYWEDPAYDDNLYINPIVEIPVYDQQ